MAKVAVIGMSSFGYYLALKLSDLGSEVLAVDYSEEAVNRVKDRVAKAVVADATDKQVLVRLGLADMHSVVLSLGDKLESSILAALHLREIKVKNLVAKALSEDHARILELIGVDRIVFPERDMGERLAQSLHGRNVSDYLPLGSGLSIVDVIPTKEMIGKSLEELDFRKRYGCQVLAVKERKQREGEKGEKVIEETAFIPEPNAKIESRHVLVLLGREENLKRFLK